MVKILNNANKQAVTDAIAQAGRTTSAGIFVVVTPASDVYHSYLLLYGLIVGSAIDTGLWTAKLLTAFPLLLIVQIACMSLFSFTPFLRHLCIRLVPKRMRHHRAAHRAFEEYMLVSQHLAEATPIVLLYVSLAERYAHIVTSRSVREKLPDEHWNSVIATFTSSVKNTPLQEACIGAVQHMARLLAPQFPPTDTAHRASHSVIEIS